MGIYRKKPVVVEARKLGVDNDEELALWCGGRTIREYHPTEFGVEFVALNIPTLEGVMRAGEGDYIIKGIKGEFYPCKPDIFEATYEEV